MFYKNIVSLKVIIIIKFYIDIYKKSVLEQFASLREEFEKLEEVVHKSNQIDLVVEEDDVAEEEGN